MIEEILLITSGITLFVLGYCTFEMFYNIKKSKKLLEEILKALKNKKK